MAIEIPTIQDIEIAQKTVYQFIDPTPLYPYVTLSDLVGTKIWVKHENHLPTGAFKVRGGLHLVAHLSQEQKASGLYTASTGNHGQSIAYAGKVFEVNTFIAVPKNANPGKVAAMKGLGANVLFYGKDFDEARDWVKQLSEKKWGKFIGPTDEQLIQGVGTYALEILKDLPIANVIIVPVGAGSGVCGTGIVAKAINPKIKIIAVQSAQAPAMQLSWESGKMVEAEMNTFAEGIATRITFLNTQQIMRKVVDEFILVEDEEIRTAILMMMKHTHNLVEGAAAAPLAAALKMREKLKNKNVVLIASGGNISIKTLKDILKVSRES